MTAVEFLLEKITLKKLENDVYLYPRVTNEDIEQAKEMFEKQIINAFKRGAINKMNGIEEINSEQYYNETFKDKL